jgi:hypothetical protein
VEFQPVGQAVALGAPPWHAAIVSARQRGVKASIKLGLGRRMIRCLVLAAVLLAALAQIAQAQTVKFRTVAKGDGLSSSIPRQSATIRGERRTNVVRKPRSARRIVFDRTVTERSCR